MTGRVLIVAYNFPPIGGVGIQRTLKYATYLPRFGWEPVVLTARNPGVAIRDEEAERHLPPDLIVERALSLEPIKLRHIAGRLMRPLRSRGQVPTRAAGATATSVGSTTPTTPAMPRAASPWLRGVAWIWAAAMRVTFFPDEQVGWVPFAVRRGLAIHRNRPLDVVYSSSPPVSSHLAAALIARRTGLPWVADFRDPWIGNAFARAPRAIHGHLQRRIESRIAAMADRIVFATDGLAAAFATRHPSAAGKCVVIPNGYDRSDLAAAGGGPVAASAHGAVEALATTAAAPGASGLEGVYRLVYGGSLYGETELETFLAGLELLVSRRPEIRDRLAVEFVGWINMQNQVVAARFGAADRLGPMVTYAGFRPHSEAVARLQAADALLQLIGDGPNKGQVTGGKLMEYIGLDRPILAVVPDGDARKLLSELDWGVVADPTPEGVADGLERLLAAPNPTRSADPAGRYDRVNLAGRLAVVLDEVAK